ncbi:hypothetical protein CKM354_001048600 [Cercospora kikuchii]|uniref:Uncharacterized protein n=1 Tax=Cercospora kikuchii TaxID=84275 RepID=A0A9P3CR42_9PEZI|nr:uncharacterized protein CKM354_001048600 [Cercospora kikuchii]GIZ47393.1 hypothetical protein CKM354_001048600 [Cercospora kikuchii]
MVIHKDGVAIRDWKWYHNHRHVPLHRISLPAIWNDKETFAARGWQWFLDHGGASVVPIHRVYEGDEELVDPWKKNETEAEAARPRDVNDVLIQMVRIAEHLKRRGHHVKSWANVRIRLRDEDLCIAPGITCIEAQLVVKHAEVFPGLHTWTEGCFLDGRLGTMEDDIEFAKDVLKSHGRLPPYFWLEEEAIAAKIKVRRTMINKRHRDGSPRTKLEKSFVALASYWEKVRKEPPNSLNRYQEGMRFKRIFQC